MAKSGDSAAAQWASKKPGLESMVSAAGWTPQVAAEAAAVLADLAAKSPAAYLAAATWRMAQLAAAWKGAVRRLGSGGGSGSGSGTGAAEAEGRHIQLAVQLWAAVSDLLRRGLLAPPAGSSSGKAGADEPLRQQAAAQCQRALRALGLSASAEHVAALAAGRSKGSKGGSGGSGGAAGGGSSSSGGGQEGGEGEYSLGLSDARFQLRHCGHLLPHAAPPERDPRVESFNPDPWQRKVRPPRLLVSNRTDM